LKIYVVAYATTLALGRKLEDFVVDDAKVFSDEGEAEKCAVWDRKRMKIGKEDLMLRVVPIEVHDRFDKKRYEREEKK